ncbi:restriction endonuclease subunit S [Vibrio tapetis]|uniref:Type I restriction modification DNA specificity domain-containing protein n=1 Tax=Vibrio tapetis subsp. tapetis TaxID=1671868 RepID=A0A2N8ZET7_9VIBR|nr:restriction endonuclease subunit S [Vibrio tapetis]SON50419.1 protein of unknown function [Vibrio tapetis subsp. tapetis]
MSNLVPEGWCIKLVSEAANNLDGKRIPLKSTDRANRQGAYRYYGASSVIDYVDDYIFDGEYILLGEDGENVLSRNLPLAFRVNGKFWVNNHAHVLQPKEGVDIGYLCEALESIDYSIIASGSAQPKITQGALNQIRLLLPPLPEQKKIAKILTSVDEVLEKTQAQIDKLKDLKTGMMQELLTRGVGVDGKPHAEFKDSPVGRIPKEWEVVKFKDIFHTYKYGPRFSSKDYDELGNVKTIRGTDLSSNGVIKYSQVPVAKLDSKLVTQNALNHGDLVMITTADCGATAVFESQSIPYIASAYAIKLTPKKGLNSKYINYFMQTDEALSQVDSFVRKGTVANLPGSDVMSIILALPPFDEQNQVVRILEMLDENITLKLKVLDSKKSLKKALMQDLLTGKKRVKVDS